MVDEKYLFGAVALLAVAFVGLMLIAGGSNASASQLQQSGSTLSASVPSASASANTASPATVGCNAAGAGTTAGCGCGGAQTGKLSGCGVQAASGANTAQKTGGCGCRGNIADDGAASGTTGGSAGAASSGSATGATAPAGSQQVSLTATGSGYDKETIYVKAGVPVHFAFTAINAGCGSQLIIDKVGVQLVSRNGQTVYADFTPTAPGSYNYHCGMNMFRGVLVAQ